jgi:hypothetical protein
MLQILQHRAAPARQDAPTPSGMKVALTVAEEATVTIAVSVKVGEGLVMAADSTSSYFEGGVLAQSYHHARKLLQLSDYPIGMLTYGLGDIGGRNLESLLAEFERIMPSHAGVDPYTVRSLADQVYAFIRGKYDEVFPSPSVLPLTVDTRPSDWQPDAESPGEPEKENPSTAVTIPDVRPSLGVVIGGYSRSEFFPDEFEFLLPVTVPSEIWPDPEVGRQQYGVRWWGQTGPIERLYLGCDTAAIQWFMDNGLSQADAVKYYLQLQDRLMWPIIYQGMPIQDAIDLAVYLVNVTIGHSRFAMGPPLCGGQIDVATVTARGFRWVKRKDWVVKTDSVFF